MPAIRVVPPFNPRGAALLGAVVGGVLALVVMRIGAPVIFGVAVLGVSSHVASGILLLTLLLPPIAHAALLARSTDRPEIAALSGAAFGAALVATVCVVEICRQGDGGASEPMAVHIRGSTGLIALAAAAGALLFLIVNVLARVLLFRLVEHTPALCHRCGYELGGPAITTCPECGASTTPVCYLARRRLLALSLAQRLARPAAAVGLAVLLLAIAATIHYRTVPSGRFLRTFTRDGVVTGWTTFDHPTRGGPAQYHSVAASIPIPDDPSRRLFIRYTPDARDPVPPMTIAIAAAPADDLDLPFPDHGTPHIAIELSRDLADRVAREGIPPALVSALDQAAARGGWTPSGVATLDLPRIDRDFDPAPHFRPR